MFCFNESGGDCSEKIQVQHTPDPRLLLKGQPFSISYDLTDREVITPESNTVILDLLLPLRPKLFCGILGVDYVVY